eukprot:Rhum_TRINITY_DN14666_c8_g2::Rhum_TRINITY_DN14666_c8_g2_i1::g.107228::m.107228
MPSTSASLVHHSHFDTLLERPQPSAATLRSIRRTRLHRAQGSRQLVDVVPARRPPRRRRPLQHVRRRGNMVVVVAVVVVVVASLHHRLCRRHRRRRVEVLLLVLLSLLCLLARRLLVPVFAAEQRIRLLHQRPQLHVEALEACLPRRRQLALHVRLDLAAVVLALARRAQLRDLAVLLGREALVLRTLRAQRLLQPPHLRTQCGDVVCAAVQACVVAAAAAAFFCRLRFGNGSSGQRARRPSRRPGHRREQPVLFCLLRRSRSRGRRRPARLRLRRQRVVGAAQRRRGRRGRAQRAQRRRARCVRRVRVRVRVTPVRRRVRQRLVRRLHRRQRRRQQRRLRRLRRRLRRRGRRVGRSLRLRNGVVWTLRELNAAVQRLRLLLLLLLLRCCCSATLACQILDDLHACSAAGHHAEPLHTTCRRRVFLC